MSRTPHTTAAPVRLVGVTAVPQALADEGVAA